MNVMEIYSLESASISGIHSKWIFADSWEMLCEYYRWIRLVILRMGYGREDERIAELRQMVEEGLISRDAIRKIAAVSLKDTGDVQERLLGKIAEQPLVSVIICVHNSEDVIGDAIESVLNQSYQNLELLLVDDASTDNSRQVILSYEDSRIKPIFLKKNRHVCYTCNVGFQQARGKYVAVMGHDDMWSPDKLEKQVSFLEEHPGYHVCFSWVNIIDEHKHIRNREEQGMYKMFNSDNAKATEWISSLIRYSNRLCAPSACIRRSILEKAGHYRYALLQLQDYDLWLRCRPCPLTVRMPSSVVAVIPSRWATAMSFFMASVTVWPHTTSTWERRSRSRLMSMPLLCSSGTASLRNKGRYSVGQMGEKPASYTTRQYRAACSVFL